MIFNDARKGRIYTDSMRIEKLDSPDKIFKSCVAIKGYPATIP